MPTVRKFEDLEAWKEARALTKGIYACSRQGAFSRDFGLRDQMTRAAVSILSNIAEGFERGGDGEFLQFLSIAKGSSGELRAQLCVAADQKYLTTEQFAELHSQAPRVSRLISGLMQYLRRSELKGTKFR